MSINDNGKLYRATTFGAMLVFDVGAQRELDPRLDLRNHSPTGFSWGYNGSGCAQLALALLCDVLQDDERAKRLYQRFKEFTVATVPRDQPFEITELKVLEIVDTLEREFAEV